MSNVLQQLPERVRGLIYVGYSVLVLAAGATATWFTSVGSAVPDWVTGSTQVLAYIGAGLGLVAAGNTSITSKLTEPELYAEGELHLDEVSIPEDVSDEEFDRLA